MKDVQSRLPRKSIMASTGLSQSPTLRIIGGIIAFIPLGFGINALLRPRNAFEFFEFEVPATPNEQRLVDNLMLFYGARDAFMAAALFVTAYYGNRKALGWLLIAAGAVAGVDGYAVNNQIGTGEWNHWGYAPVITTLGALLLGVLG
ncbi:hypothetical protein FQN54_007847 [Arachnomyces sp. PD_36]|nr:hypothetical protein FQN54_007847 [Arachnomyces sp. PD_36]